ncbi:lysin [Rhodococcus phage RGL3]|uniref:lysozyme n=1 Tax=Rhodococcus phage RGL3 TaxID=2922221 RepID=G9FHQ8_9CAUD|nr:endolysin [Rhodococcus phage RGL3]AEV52146.1 lysin [Rhodococcus phage RGL3]
MPRNAYTLTSGFGPRWGAHHSGLDLGAPDGTPFYACQAGTVQYIGAASGYGQWLVIDSSDAEGGGCVEYGHMWNAFATGLKVGDRVSAGQLIGYVGSNGQSTGPHLHITVWERGYGGRRIDPEVWLERAGFLGETATPPPAQEAPTVLYGIDVSNHQGEFNFAAAKSEGFVFATHKVTEGTGYRDPYWARARREMEAHFPGRWGGYVFCRTNTDPAAEARYFYDAVGGDTTVPVQIDYEDTTNGGSGADLFARVRAFQDLGFRLLPIYVPRWFWEGRMGRPDLSGLPVPIWNSHYARGVDFASTLYDGHTAKNAAWADMGGKPVGILQFSETARVAGQLIDVNAFRGTESELDALFGSEELSMSAVQEIKDYIDIRVTGPIGSDVKDLREQSCGQGARDAGQYNGWPQLGDRTIADALAVIGVALKIEGFFDPRSIG